MVRGKFFVIGIEKQPYAGSAPRFKFGAVSKSDKEGSENTFFSQATPSGTIEMTIDNPAAAAQFELGKCYYVDFTPVPAE